MKLINQKLHRCRQENKLEVRETLTREDLKYDSVFGWLTAEEVFERFKPCYENKTCV